MNDLDKKINKKVSDNTFLTDKGLIKAAGKAKENSYSPYSKFRVGAALMCKGGKIYTGCNIENATYGATCCAERTAIFKAVSEGEREFEAIAIKADSDNYTFPCGICRQVLYEFSEDIRIVVSDNKNNTKTMLIKELLPNAFLKEENI